MGSTSKRLSRMAFAALRKRFFTKSWPDTAERSCSLSMNSRRPDGLRLDDLLLLLLEVGEADLPVLLEALGGELVEVHEVQAAGDPGELGDRRATPPGAACRFGPGSARKLSRTLSSGIGMFTLMALGERTMVGLRSARFSVSRMIETSPCVKMGSFAQRLRVTRQ